FIDSQPRLRRGSLPSVLRGISREAASPLTGALLDDRVGPVERTAADELCVAGVDRDILLLRMLAAALRRYARNRALQDLEQRVLHTLARDVARDRRVLGFAGDLVDLVDVDDAALALGDVDVARLQPP